MADLHLIFDLYLVTVDYKGMYKFVLVYSIMNIGGWVNQENFSGKA